MWRLMLVPILSFGHFIGGCAKMQIGPSVTAQSERVEQVSGPLSDKSRVAAATHNGCIQATGAERAECRVTATIHAEATTAEEAKALVDKAHVKLVPSTRTLTVQLEEPTLLPHQSVWADYKITVLRSAGLDLSTHNGKVVITGIAGKVRAATHNGSLTIEEVSGPLNLEAHNGPINVRGITGDIRAASHNGRIFVRYDLKAPKECRADLTSHNGDIDFTAPPEASARIAVMTHNGGIHTDLPLTIKGRIDRQLTGTVGEGKGTVHLETYNGSVSIK